MKLTDWTKPPFTASDSVLETFLHRPFGKGRGFVAPLTVILIVAAIASGTATYFALNAATPEKNNPDTVIWLLTLNLVILLGLAALIARQIAAVISRRRQGVAGSRLHTRLVAIFSLMAAAPAVIMAVFSTFFFHYGIQSWFSDRVRTAVMESQAVAEAYLEEHQQVIKADVLAMANDIDRTADLYTQNRAEFDQFLETQAFLRNLSEAMIFTAGGDILAQSGLTFTLAFEDIPKYLLDQTEGGEVVITTTAQDDRVRALVRLSNFNNAYLFVGRMVDPTVLSHLASTRSATAEYNDLQSRIGNLQVLVTLIFIAIAILLLLIATWIGLSLARQLVEPIGNLITASDRLRAGNTGVRVAEGGQIEEFDYLSKSFNRMTQQLEEQRNDLVMANRQLDHRRRFTETVLAGVSAGIMGVDKNGIVTIVNTSAASLLGRDIQALTGRNIDLAIPGMAALIATAQAKPNKVHQAEIPLSQGYDVKRIFLVRITADSADDDRGAVITFDDITELQSAQRKAAWADVARRIAHEIKNPLTPIMLSAERLKRKYMKEVQTDPQIFAQCVETITRHVGDIGRMVNEFSAFARMPEPVMQSFDLNAEVRETLALQREAHSDITFRLKGALSDRTPLFVTADPQQIRQAFTNLVQNAIDSIHGRIKEGENTAPGQVDILLATGVPEAGWMTLAVIDNGRGLPKGVAPTELMEPYVTHREKGTGLGLAIVKKIMEDHGGRVAMGTAEAGMAAHPAFEDLGGATIALVLPAGRADNQGGQKVS